jgi:hypothetical protein
MLKAREKNNYINEWAPAKSAIKPSTEKLGAPRSVGMKAALMAACHTRLLPHRTPLYTRARGFWSETRVVFP